MSEYKKSIHLYDDAIGRVDYVSHMGSDLTVVNSARVSFGNQRDALDKRDRKLIRYLIAHKHTSTLEHCVVTYKFTVPLYIRSQHHRHRTWSYNEISRRYTEKDLQFYCPREFRTQHKSNRQASNTEELIDPHLYKEPDAKVFRAFHPKASETYREHCSHSLRLFEELINKGVCREQARGVLPQTLYTEYYGTVNLNNLLKFVSLRLHDGAQWEIQKVAEACLEIAADLFPITVRSFRDITGHGKVQKG
jgi:thymidylate synthase (FAD)